MSLSAWGSTGPWGGRRGFDSIVQAASGIAVAESADGDRPGAMPCQLLDHGTGYLSAAAALRGLADQAVAGGTQVRELSLARTAHWLLGSPAAPVGSRGSGGRARGLADHARQRRGAGHRGAAAGAAGRAGAGLAVAAHPVRR